MINYLRGGRTWKLPEKSYNIQDQNFLATIKEWKVYPTKESLNIEKIDRFLSEIPTKEIFSELDEDSKMLEEFKKAKRLTVEEITEKSGEKMTDVEKNEFKKCSTISWAQ